MDNIDKRDHYAVAAMSALLSNRAYTDIFQPSFENLSFNGLRHDTFTEMLVSDAFFIADQMLVHRIFTDGK